MSSTLLADPPSNETIDVFYIKTKTVWTIINKVTRKVKKSNHLPHTLQMDNTEVAIERSAEVFNNYF